MSEHLEDDVNDLGQERMKALYDATPFPEVLGKARFSNFPLIDYWINNASGHNMDALHSSSKILVAGCGTGVEAFNLAKHFANGSVVGVDFSEKSIQIAKEKLSKENIDNLSFLTADLTDSSWYGKFDKFDFVLCHAVADYVVDSKLLMQNLSNCLAEHGIIYMTVNSPSHPAKRIQNAFSKLGFSSTSFIDTDEQRNLLKSLDTLMGNKSGLEGIGDAATGYLQVDIFPPISHHHSVDSWCSYALDSKLYFCGSMEALYGLPQISDEELVPLFKLSRAELSKWMIQLRAQPSMQLLFGKSEAFELDFSDIEAFWNFKFILDSSVGALPEVEPDPTKSMAISIRFTQLPDFVIHSTAYELTVMRHCNGERTIRDIVQDIPIKPNVNKLRSCLFRAYQYGLLSKG